MKVMIDGFNLGLDKGTGVATYGRNLSRTVRSIGHEVGVLYGRGKPVKFKNPLLHEIAFFDAAGGTKRRLFEPMRLVVDAAVGAFGFQVDDVPTTEAVLIDSMKSVLPAYDQLWNSTHLYEHCNRTFNLFNSLGAVSLPGVDIAHWTYPLPIHAKNAANIYTFHDLVPLRLPHTTLDNKRKYLKLCKRLVDTADHIVTVSETSRLDIINLLGADPGKVTNTYQSVSFPPHVFAKTEVQVKEELAGTFNLEYKKYFLFFGAIEPKKNINRLLEAYLGCGVDTPLVIVGAPGWKSDEELRLLSALNGLPKSAQRKKDRIIRLEYLPFSLLVSVIRGAKATFFPSLYEGFGLPVLESMALGTAVLTSNTSSLPEVAGDAACLIDPYDTQAMAEAMRALDTNDAWRLSLEAKGREQAKLFSEEAYAKRLQALYQSVIETKRKQAR